MTVFACTPARDSSGMGLSARSSVPASPAKLATNTASPTCLCSSTLSPFAAACATSGVTRLGRKDMIQNALLNVWLAAPIAASDAGSPARPTQKTSTAPTSGMMKKLARAGTHRLKMTRSSSSRRGSRGNLDALCRMDRSAPNKLGMARDGGALFSFDPEAAESSCSDDSDSDFASSWLFSEFEFESPSSPSSCESVFEVAKVVDAACNLLVLLSETVGPRRTSV
mmetsp:Transcript_15035/g.37880  ORF Transcript_15035/g.37880 Transcript_15035/m.37880 type:complete len:225 (+) Transcript_15035:1381-2055(+)